MGFNGVKGLRYIDTFNDFFCYRVHRSLDSRLNFLLANPAIVSRRNSISCRLNTTGILLFSLFTNFVNYNQSGMYVIF